MIGRKKMKAIWGLDYDFRTDKNYKRPCCPECEEPILRRDDGYYHCLDCGRIVMVEDPEMDVWLKKHEEVKVEYEDCAVITDKEGNHLSGCGGKKCVETHYMRNPVTDKWQVMGGKCIKCGTRFIV